VCVRVRAACVRLCVCACVAGEWEAPKEDDPSTTTEEVRPQQRLLIVTATYRHPRLRLGQTSSVVGGGKFSGFAGTTLVYGDRSAFIAGLDDILSQPSLTMEQEFARADRCARPSTVCTTTLEANAHLAHRRRALLAHQLYPSARS
jgi:hypothetical protein